MPDWVFSMKKLFRTFALAISLWAFVSPNCTRAADSDDLIFEGGLVVDGSGSPGFRGDVAVRDGRISGIGTLSEDRKIAAKRRIDARSLVVTPGFIDLLGQSEYNVLVDPRAASKITQGITTEVTGEGMSIAPTNPRLVAAGEETWKRYGVRPDWTNFTGYFEAFRRKGSAINIGTCVGLGTIRAMVIGEKNRRARPEELEKMGSLVDQSMREGVLGVSTALEYVPDMYNSTEEIIAMAKVAASYGGIYFTHQRSESDQIDVSLDEVFRIAREAHIPANIWHLKTSHKSNWGRMPHVLERLEKARAEGLDVAANQYPWSAAENGIDANMPEWVREGGTDKLLSRLADPVQRQRARNDILSGTDKWENEYLGAGGPTGVMIATVLNPDLKKYEGMTIAQIAAEQKKDPLDALMDFIIADKAASQNIIFVMNEDDVRAALKHRLVAFCTDSSAEAEDGIFSQEKSHPRGWASTAQILSKYVRDEKLLPIEEAVRKMTSLGAARAHLFDRGLLREGMAADVVAFDLSTVAVHSTYADPIHYSTGIPYVAVNGALVVDNRKITDSRPGRILLGSGYK